MQTVTHPVTIKVAYNGRIYSYTADRADLMNDGTGSNFDFFCRKMRELLVLSEKQPLELEFRSTDGKFWPVNTKEALDNMLKLHPDNPATVAARIKPKSLLSSPYTWLVVGAAGVGAYLYLSRPEPANSLPAAPAAAAAAAAITSLARK